MLAYAVTAVLAYMVYVIEWVVEELPVYKANWRTGKKLKF